MEKQNKKFSSKIAKLVMTLFIVVVSINIFTQINTYKNLKQKEAELTALLKEQEDKQIELNSKKDYYTSDSYIEDTARNKLGLVKPNEKIFVNRSDSN